MYSIVIIVKNDRGIEGTLATLKPKVHARKDTEVIMIDASARTTLQDIKANNPWVRWFYYQNKENKQFTIPEQRNMGIAKAKGDIIIFLDANCLPSSAWLPTIRKAFADESLAAVTGPIKSIGGDTFHDAGYELFDDNQAMYECGAANFAVRRELLVAVNGFDTDLSYGEDVDLAWRLIDAGHQITFKKRMTISHNWGEFEEDKRRAFRYGVSRAMLYRKHPNRLSNLLGPDINVLIYPAFMLLLPLTIWIHWYPLLLAIPLLKNIGNEPVKKTLLHFMYGAGVLKGMFKAGV